MCGLTVFKAEKLTKEIKKALELIDYRGPDQDLTIEVDSGVYMDFRRLAIMDLSNKGMQPFTTPSNLSLVCNGEIYNYKTIKQEFTETYQFSSESDCEVLLPLIEGHGLEASLKIIDGEFAFVGWDSQQKRFFAARDAFGIRPLFYGKTPEGEIAFSSEAKVLLKWCKDVTPFPPGHFYQEGKFHCFRKISSSLEDPTISKTKALKRINEKLRSAVKKRMDSDAPVGFLLSGGLDSSLVCAIAAEYSDKPIKTFAVGIEENPIDTKYAQIVADAIGSDHTEVLFSKKDILETLSDLIYRLETYDITTIRASMGMDLVCRYIKEHTDIKVLMTGECSDELFGYKYTDFAPSAAEFQKEAIKRVDELYIYDVLRADRCISSNSLEARVPFSDNEFAEFVMSIPAELKMNTTGHGKYLLRAAFEKDELLPTSILFREKAAFSDAVGHASVDFLKAIAELAISDDELKKAFERFPHATPKGKEAYLYRQLFEGHFPGQSRLIKDFWLPNKEWENCDVDDPSARVLPNYGASGF